MACVVKATIAAGGLFSARVASTFRIRERIRPLIVQYSSSKQFTGSGSSGEDVGITKLWRDAANRVPETVMEEPNRLLIVGDIHGDLNAWRRCLVMAELINPRTKQWTGEDAVLIQAGDVFDRGDNDLHVEEELYELGEQARRVGGRVVSILGNHEVMNAHGDHRMATRKAFEPFMHLYPDVDAFLEGDWSVLSKLPTWAQCRVGSMLPAGPVSKKLLARHPVAVKVGRTLIVHGGIHPLHVPNGVESLINMNESAFRWLAGFESDPPHGLVFCEDSPVWSRKYSSPDNAELDDESFALLEEVLGAIGCDQMVVGHTPQRKGINAAAGGRVWRVDVGMTKVMGGKPEVLEIMKQGKKVRVLTEAGPLEGEELIRLRYPPGRRTEEVADQNAA